MKFWRILLVCATVLTITFTLVGCGGKTAAPTGTYYCVDQSELLNEITFNNDGTFSQGRGSGGRFTIEGQKLKLDTSGGTFAYKLEVRDENTIFIDDVEYNRAASSASVSAVSEPETGIGDPSAPYYGLIVEWNGEAIPRETFAWLDEDLVLQYAEDERDARVGLRNAQQYGSGDAWFLGIEAYHKDGLVEANVVKYTASKTPEEFGQVISFGTRDAVCFSERKLGVTVSILYSMKLNRVVTAHELGILPA